MTMKETPLIRAVSRSGAWPEFFFSNPVVCGFMPMPLCALMGALAIVFYASLGAAEQALELFIIVRYGAMFGVAIGFALCIIVVLRSLITREDIAYYRQFFLGNVLGVAALWILDLLTFPAITAWLATVERIQ